MIANLPAIDCLREDNEISNEDQILSTKKHISEKFFCMHCLVTRRMVTLSDYQVQRSVSELFYAKGLLTQLRLCKPVFPKHRKIPAPGEHAII